mgnify:CR=1 FL=1
MSIIRNYTINFFGNEKKYITNCIDTKWISTNGKYVDKFSKKLQKFLKSKYVIPLNSGTAALHLALRAINVEKNDEVIVPTITFIASVNAIKYCNAFPIFIDTDKDFIIDENKVIKFLQNNTTTKNHFTINKKTKKIIKAIIVVSTWGISKDLKKLKKVCKLMNIKIIEDAAESLGSKINKKKFSGTFGDISCISFNANKIITAGGGGALITNNKEIAKKVYYLSVQAKDNSKYFIHNDVGYNYRMTDIQAAIGLAQLEKINTIINFKRTISLKYLNNLKNVKKALLLYNDKKKISKYNCWMNILSIDKKKFNIIKFIDYMNFNKVDVRPVWKLNHLQQQYKKCEKFEITNAQKLSSNSICLPSSTSLSFREINQITDLIISYINNEKY